MLKAIGATLPPYRYSPAAVKSSAVLQERAAGMRMKKPPEDGLFLGTKGYSVPLRLFVELLRWLLGPD